MWAGTRPCSGARPLRPRRARRRAAAGGRRTEVDRLEDGLLRRHRLPVEHLRVVRLDPVLHLHRGLRHASQLQPEGRRAGPRELADHLVPHLGRRPRLHVPPAPGDALERRQAVHVGRRGVLVRARRRLERQLDLHREHEERRRAQPDDRADDPLALRRPVPDRVRPDRPGAHLGAARRHARAPHQVQSVLPDGRKRPVQGDVARPERHDRAQAQPVLLRAPRQDPADPAHQVPGRRRGAPRPRARAGRRDQHGQDDVGGPAPKAGERQDVGVAGPGLRRDRDELVPAPGLADVHRAGQERERQGGPGSGDPPGAELGDRPPGAGEDHLQRPLHARDGDHLVVLQEPRLLHVVRRRPGDRVHVRPREGPPGAGAGRLGLPGRGLERDLYQGRDEGRVHARPALVGLPAAERGPPRQGLGGGGRNQDRPRHDHRGRAQRQDLQPDELQGQGRRRQVRAHVRRVHLGLVRRPDDARLRLRGAGLREPVVGLVLVRQALHGAHEAGAHRARPQEAGRPAAPGRADRARRVALHHLRLRALPLGDADRHLDELPALAAADRPAVRRELDSAPAHQPRGEGGHELRRHDLGDRLPGGDDGAHRERRVHPPQARGAPAVRAARADGPRAAGR